MYLDIDYSLSFFKIVGNVTHMPSGGLRAIQLSNRGEV
jgi:hypothetical protein